MKKPPPAPFERLQIKPSIVDPVILPVSRKLVNGPSIERTRTFYHTGDLGDIIAALSAMKALGGGRLQIGPDMGFPMATGRPRNPGSPVVVENVYDLFMLQPYIASVEYREVQQFVDYNFNEFRKWLSTRQGWDLWESKRDLALYYSLASAQQCMFDARLPETEAWLQVDSAWPIDGKPIVIHRSPRYHNIPDTFPWGKIVQRYGDKIAMVGLEDEHREFCKLFGSVRYVRSGNILTLARLIAGAKIFIGNQSSPFWMAEGLKQNLILEGWTGDPNCYFRRPGHHAVFDGDWPVILRTIERYLNEDLIFHDVQKQADRPKEDLAVELV